MRGRIFLRDRSLLEFLEMVVVNEVIERPGYRFHWQDVDGGLIIRWDNAKHHPEISGFPHHKHVRSESRVEPSTQVGLMDVLEMIGEEIIGGWNR